jgi:hypothetical protein
MQYTTYPLILSNNEKVVFSLGLRFLPNGKVDRNRLITSNLNSILKLDRKLQIGMSFRGSY